MDAYITKPLDLARLAESIHQWSESRPIQTSVSGAA
jgi:hypothetical protein